MMACSKEEFDSLVSLLDDEDLVVKECVMRRLASLGTPVVKDLRTVGGHAAADSLAAQFCLEEFKDLPRRAGGLPLLKACSAVSPLFDRGFDRALFEDNFLKMASEYAAEASDQRTAVENIRIFNHIFYRRLGFAVYDLELSDPSYAMLGKVMQSRGGNPFAIALLYYMMAQVGGLPLRVICFPGGCLPVYIEGGRELFYINVLRGGEILHRERLQEFIAAMGIRIGSEAFSLKDEKAMMTIYLESLQVVFSEEALPLQMRTLEQILDLLGPERYLTVDEDRL